MPRRQRFANLNAALNYLRPASGGGVSPEAPAGTPLRNYQEYRAGRVRRTVTRQTTSNPGIRSDYDILLFGEDTANDSAIIGVGSRAAGSLPLGTIGLAQLGLTLRGGSSTAPEFAGVFAPAKVTFFRVTGTTGTQTRSQITGLNYRSRNGNSFTLPFGKVAATDRYRDRASAIDSGSGANVICSFQPEDIII